MDASGGFPVVFDHKGRVGHDSGVVNDAPGIYLLGGSLLRTRRSSYIAGASHDTEALADHLHHHLSSATTRRRPARNSRAIRNVVPASPIGVDTLNDRV